jgi:putative transposase
MAGWLIDELKDEGSISRFLLHAWTVMPDHLHVLLEGADEECDLLHFATQFKRRTAKSVRIARNLRLWQRRFHDHILRPTDSFHGVAAYIWMNPVRKGICKRPEDYPYSGSLTIEWKQSVMNYPEWRPPWKESL